MVRIVKRYRQKVGLAPGSVVFTGTQKADKVKIDVLLYDRNKVDLETVGNLNQLRELIKSPAVTWVNFTGLHDTELLDRMREIFNIHPLYLEDIANPGTRPKLELDEDNLFVVVKMMTLDNSRKEIDIEQVSFVLGAGYLVSFQEKEGDLFDPIRERLKNVNGRLRQRAADYLLFALMDVIVDNYFLALEHVGERISDLEDQIFEAPCREHLQAVHAIKRDLTFVRKAVRPLREIVGSMIRDELELIEESTEPYLRDLYDHIIQVIEISDAYREMTAGLQDAYLSSISNKTNEVMKVLTIIATMFIPLTFLAGVYGMNFEHMPELKWPWSYAVFWLVILVVSGLMIWYFKRKKWL